MQNAEPLRWRVNAKLKMQNAKLRVQPVGVGASTTRIVGRSEAKPRVLNECPVDIQTPRCPILLPPFEHKKVILWHKPVGAILA